MFELKKVQLTRYGGLEVSYTKSEDVKDDGQENPIDYKIKSIAEPHPDLKNLIEGMAAMVADCFEMMPEKQDDRLILERIKVKGVEFASGNSVLIHFEWIARNNAGIKMATPRIKLDENVWGWEPCLSEAVKNVADETLDYINGKRAQLSLFDENLQPATEG